jgi:lipid-A-disaccharide synthase
MSGGGVLMVAGEASGDLHAARLLTALRERRPGLEAFGLGSRELARAGAELIADSREISVVGISEAWSVVERAREIQQRLLREVERRRPALAILVDFPDFNLRLARALKWLGLPIVYYVSPQVWAWRRWRVRAIASDVDRMLVLFPFEVPFYERHDVPVVHVGHPLVDEVPELPQAWDGIPLGARPDRYEIALLPGSRRSEIETLLPVLLESVRRLGEHYPVHATLVLAPSIERASVDAHLERFADLDVTVAEERRFEVVAGAHLALCASGTATLETGLLRTPLVVVYRVSRWTWRVARFLVRVAHVSLVNLVLGESVVPELLQREATAARVAATAAGLLTDRSQVDRMRERLATLRARLGAPGASRRAAAEIDDFLREREQAA